MCTGAGGGGETPSADGGGGGEKEPRLVLDATCLRDVPKSFAQLKTEGVTLAIGDGAVFQGDETYQYAFHKENNLGLDNHFQGVVRYGPYVYIAGGDRKTRKAHLLIAHMASQETSGPWRANLDAQGQPARGDRFVRKLDITQGVHWHGGGIDRHGTILAVPVENTKSEIGARGSTILFWELSTPMTPKLLNVTLQSSEIAHAVGLTRRPGDQRFLLVRWDDRKLDFFLSKGPSLADGFPQEPHASWQRSALQVDTKEVGEKGMHGQAISLLSQCDGTIFALMNDNTSRLPFGETGVNFLDLYRFDFPQNDLRQMPTIHKVASRAFSCPEQRCNFTAAGGAFVDANALLVFSSVPYFRLFEGKLTYVTEFATSP